MKCKDCRYIDYWHDLGFICCDITGRLLKDDDSDECNCEKEREEKMRNDEVRFPWARSHGK